MQAKLIPVGGGRPIVLTRDVTVVGRKRGVCDVYLQRPSVSKLHCLIVKTDGLLFIRDLGSTNGTKVNGQRVVRGALLPGDELAFAEARFRVFLGPDDPEPPTEASTEMLDSLPDAGHDLADSRLVNLQDGEEVGVGSESDVRILSDDTIH
ncbi:MAG TPA: FHA domain-containing protein [Planctomycetaceae bacterium]|nr:FHA domain-containing protein [Planctomycetaceae bacterium]